MTTKKPDHHLQPTLPMPSRICRSYLFVPANRLDRIAKAHAALPHAVIVDLEDAVPPAEKAAARNALAQNARAIGTVLVRVNGPESEWFEEDVKACLSIPVGGILVPKAEHADHIRKVAALMPPGIPVLPLIETALGFANARSIAEVQGVQRLVFGSVDFQLDLGISGENEELLYFRSGLVLASKLAGIQPPVDGVNADFNDLQSLREASLRARRQGFGAKLCIHPKQVPVVNTCFQPTDTEVAWAKRIVEAAQAAQGAAFAVDGKMVDRPVILQAMEIIRESAQ